MDDDELEADATDESIPIGQIRFGFALRVAVLFKAVGVLVLMILAVSAVYSYRRYSSGGAIPTGLRLEPAAEILLPSIANALVSSGMLIFFGYALELGVELYEQLFHLRFAEAGEDDAQPALPATPDGPL